MRRNKKIIDRSFILKCGLGTLIAFLISVAIVFLFKGYLSKRFAGDPYKYFRYYYDFVNYVPEGVPEFPAEEEIIISGLAMESLVCWTLWMRGDPVRLGLM